MPSPFPGMDPYLEAHWGDVHQRLVIYAADDLQGSLPPDLRARVEERVFVHFEAEMRRVVVPDVRITERPRSAARPSNSGSTAITMEPLSEPIIVHIDSEPMTESFIEIREAGGGRVVTTIEIVSLANKFAGDGQRKYQQKQREMKEAGVNIVEIDLLRQGPWILVAPEESVPPDYRRPYRICVWRSTHQGECEFYKTSLRERLPSIRIPLRQTDADVRLDLQKLIDRCYINGAYDDIDYRKDPRPPFSSDDPDAAWVRAMLQRPVAE